MVSLYAGLLMFITPCFAQTPAVSRAYATLSGFSNVSSSANPNISASTTACPISCSKGLGMGTRVEWRTVSIVATETAATVIALVDQYNHTTYSTQFNKNLSYPIPTNTNSEGTVTTAITAYDPALRRNVSTTITYPNEIKDYFTNVPWQGVLPTTYANGSSSCLDRRASETIEPLPSHPFAPLITNTPNASDPRGWTYIAVENEEWDYGLVSSLFPDFAPIQSCANYTTDSMILPQFIMEAATFTTITSTSHIIAPNVPSTPAAQTSQATTASPSPPNQPVPPAQPTVSSGQPPISLTAPNPNPSLPTQNPNSSQAVSNIGQGQPASGLNSGQPVPSTNLSPRTTIPTPTLPQTPATTPISPAQISSPAIPGSTVQPQNPAVEQPEILSSGPTVPPQLTIGGTVINPNPQGNFIIGDQTIVPGAPAVTIGGTAVAVPLTATGAAAGSVTPNPSRPDSGPAQLTLGSTAVTANVQGNFVIDGSTITPGSPPVTIANTPISIASGGSVAVIAGMTQTLVPTAAPAQLTLGSSVATANAQGNFIVAGQTVAPGGSPVTISGSTISLAPSGTAAVVNGVTQALSPPASSPRVLTVGTQTYALDASGVATVAGQTLTPGGVITASGSPISLGTEASYAVVGGSTQALGAGPTGGGGANRTSTGAGAMYTGSASRFGINVVLGVFAGLTLLAGVL